MGGEMAERMVALKGAKMAASKVVQLGDELAALWDVLKVVRRADKTDRKMVGQLVDAMVDEKVAQ